MGKQREAMRDIDDRTEDLRDLAAENPDIWAEFLNHFELSWMYHENALEGIVLTHPEVTSALKGRPIAPETYPSIRNLKVATELVRREAAQGGKVDMALVRRLHAVLGSHVPDFVPARYRKDIPLHRSYFHEIAQPAAIAARMTKLMNWAEENDPDDDNAVQYAALLHHEFMSIFPFTQHSGKVGRLLVNFVLLRHGYLPVIFHATERQRYYETLRQPKKNMEALLNDMMANCVENGTKFIQHVVSERAKVAARQRRRA